MYGILSIFYHILCMENTKTFVHTTPFSGFLAGDGASLLLLRSQGPKIKNISGIGTITAAIQPSSVPAH